MPLYPLKFEPRLLEKMWAGRKIQSVLGKPLPPATNIGESWELYDFPPGIVDDSKDWISSKLINGPLAGKTLHQLVLEFGRDLHGDVPLIGPRRQFPILIKFLDARQDLSIQVHPDRNYAAAHQGAYLKSEAWYIVQSDPGARLFKGLKAGTTAGQFKQSIAEGHCERLLNSIPVSAGDCFYLPSGTVHAVGAGILAAEVQTPSDTTFRVYDFNRVDPSTGNLRKLHVDEALACIHFSDTQEPAPPVRHTTGLEAQTRQLATCEFFEMEEARLPAGVTESLQYRQPVVWMVIEGKARIKVDDLNEPVSFGRGDTILLPPGMKNPVLKTLSPCLWLEVSLPA